MKGRRWWSNRTGLRTPESSGGGGIRAQVHGAHRQWPQRPHVVAGPQGRPDAHPFPRLLRRVERGRADAGATQAGAFPGAHHILPLGGGVGALQRLGPALPFLGEKGIAPNTPEWKEQVEAYPVQARKTMEGRLRPDIPARRYVCFYPMDKKRGEEKNWYDAPFAERQRMMQDHGHRPGLRRPGDPDHLRLHRLRRLGVGRRPLRRRSRGVQEACLTRCASTRPARSTGCSGRSTWGSSSGQRNWGRCWKAGHRGSECRRPRKLSEGVTWVCRTTLR